MVDEADVTLTDEILLLPATFGLDVDTIDAILLNGVRHSFLPSDRRTALEAGFRQELAALRAEHLDGAT